MGRVVREVFCEHRALDVMGSRGRGTASGNLFARTRYSLLEWVSLLLAIHLREIKRVSLFVGNLHDDAFEELRLQVGRTKNSHGH